MPGTPTPNHGIATMAGGTDQISTIDDTYNAGVTTIDGKLTKVFEIPINFAIMSEIRTTDIIPQVFVPIRAGQSAKLTRVRRGIGSGTSVTFKIQRNGVDATGFTGIVATTTVGDTDPADIALSNNDRLQVVITAVSGVPKDLSIALVIEQTA